MSEFFLTFNLIFCILRDSLMLQHCLYEKIVLSLFSSIFNESIQLEYDDKPSPTRRFNINLFFFSGTARETDIEEKIFVFNRASSSAFK